MSSVTGRPRQRLLHENTRRNGRHVNHHDKLLNKKDTQTQETILNLERRPRCDQTTRTHAII